MATVNNGNLMHLDNLEAITSHIVVRNQMIIVTLVIDGSGTFILNRASSTANCSLPNIEVHFRTFIELLQKSYPKPRLVSIYSAQMNITTKYLSSICKQVAGETPSHLIDYFIMKDIEYLMKYTTKSIKEIAFELTFPNLSYFGKYIRAHFGMSPKDYRKKLINNK